MKVAHQCRRLVRRVMHPRVRQGDTALFAQCLDRVAQGVAVSGFLGLDPRLYKLSHGLFALRSMLGKAGAIRGVRHDHIATAPSFATENVAHALSAWRPLFSIDSNGGLKSGGAIWGRTDVSRARAYFAENPSLSLAFKRLDSQLRARVLRRKW
jgi:hypothetical protein